MSPLTVSANFEWLLNPESPVHAFYDNRDTPWTEVALPHNSGSGGYEAFSLSLDMVLYRSNFKFNPAVSGQLIPLAKVTASFNEPTLMIHTLPKGRVIHQDTIAPNDLIYGDGIDLFRYAEKISVIPVMDTSQEIEMISLMIGKSIINDLIGQPLSDQLITKLDLLPMPKVIVKSIPNYVNHPLQHCLTSEYSASLKKLWAQARVLDFISELAKYICEEQAEKSQPDKQVKKRNKALHQYLMGLEGKFPTIDSLSAQFGRSAHSLNDEFKSEYGESIFNFILNHRLNSAHEAIKNTNVPLKQLADKLGYTHVSNFRAAFKNKFGYSPGKLRK